MDIKIERKIFDGLTIIKIHGDIDVYDSSAVHHALNDEFEKGNFKIIIDLEQVRYVDGTCFNIMTEALKKITAHKGFLGFICTVTNLLKIFNITGWSNIIPIFKSEDEAIKAAKDFISANAKN